MVVALFFFTSFISYGASVFRTCIPNTQFQLNGHICYCDDLGRWSEANCEIARRQNCQPGQIIWKDCNQCICQDDGQLQCISTGCADEKTSNPPKAPKDLDIENLWCLPFVSYYVNCSLCVCPASGKMVEARCAKDASCPFIGSSNFLEAIKQNVCIPKVMYLFPCLQCQCSDKGFFLIEKCIETCRKPQISDSTRRCIPERFYRKSCNICRCPENSIADDDMCKKLQCPAGFQLKPLISLRNKTERCHRNTFTSPRCYFCECNQNATVNENACLESECMNVDNLRNSMDTEKCSPGEMVSFCSQCLCLRNGQTDPNYCTSVCSHQEKLILLQKGINESLTNPRIIHKGAIQKAANSGVCDPNSIYLDDGKYCLCPDNGSTKFKLCVSINEETETQKKVENYTSSSAKIDFNAPCDPSTFVEFDCNTCYCQKNGKLDPKWCTYDDCEAKKIIKKGQGNPNDVVPPNGSCVPGSLSKEECNFCICPANGQLKDKACTTNSCTGLRYSSVIEKFSCDPLLYYNVDCNTCYCPKNGLKNVARCTKNICEKSFLRSEVCVPGDLFSKDCNVCVCPPNGDKSDRVCTNSTCPDSATTWKNIFKLSQTLLSNQVTDDMARSLELCFPGEEFEVGCKVCICPDMGLRVFATCTNMLCGDQVHLDVLSDGETNGKSEVAHPRTKRTQSDPTCISFNLTDTTIKECTPGSEYIIRCRQCICPFKGSINHFCRPLPEGAYCEQPFPGYNYVPSGRRNDKNVTVSTKKPEMKIEHAEITHNHTAYACDKPGRVTDECYICDCDENQIIIEEHCFKSNAEGCSRRKASFLANKLIVN